ncbi:hypothetical protein [Kitasatospora sp. NPDC093102]|uniref:hypothetical protein n=1 Tax=Kitasatospora sp. NPDC093102 TaxID=3155069 RepID=UPI0034179DE7
MPVELVAVIAIAVLVTAWLLWRFSRGTTAASGGHTAPSAAAEVGVRTEFPPEGLLVPEDVLRSVGSTSGAIWDALEAAAAPVAVEYYPVSEAEVAKFRTGPVNATAQQAMVGIVEAIKPKSPTLFRVVLPKGTELVKAAGTSGFRGFSRSGGKTAHAVLKPVAAGGALVAGWPVLAVAGTVLAVDMVAQREQRAHQRRVEAILSRQEERAYNKRITDQRSADAQLSRAISLMLDGGKPNLELALKSADDEFYTSQQFLEKHRGVIDELVDDDGKVDYRRLEETLGGKEKEVDQFIRELHLARAAIAMRRKALVTYAASLALADPANPYAALRRLVGSQVHQLEDADAVATELTERLAQVELKGRWRDSDKSVATRQERFRARVSPPKIDGDTEVRYLMTSSGEILQVLPPAENEPLQLTQDE